MVRNRGNAELSAVSSSSDDESICAQLYQSYAAGLLKYLRQHVSTQEDAEDLLLEVFLVTLKHELQLSELSETERRGWLGTVARNKLFDYYRRTRGRYTSSLDEVQETLDEEELGPEAAVMRAEEHQRLQAYMRRLSANQQEVLQLRFSAGLRCSEIATALNKRENSIRTMLSRALNTLRGFYEHSDKGAQE